MMPSFFARLGLGLSISLLVDADGAVNENQISAENLHIGFFHSGRSRVLVFHHLARSGTPTRLCSGRFHVSITNDIRYAAQLLSVPPRWSCRIHCCFRVQHNFWTNSTVIHSDSPVWVVVIAYSTLATKQHYFIDLPAGVFLALLAKVLGSRLAYRNKVSNEAVIAFENSSLSGQS